jgi:hypothetical protein
MRILQRRLYIGTIFDTLKGRVFIGKDKFETVRQDYGAAPRADAAGGVHATDDV